MIQQFVSAKVEAEFLHQYTGAPKEVYYLAFPHRHMLHIEVSIEVFSDDREVEFIMLKHNLNRWVNDMNLSVLSNLSCESVGRALLSNVQSFYGDWRGVKISVSEDGENGSTIIYTKERRSKDDVE